MRVPLLDLHAQFAPLQAELEAAVCEVMASGQYALGEYVAAFEQEICDYTGIEHAIGMSSGTDALLASLMALGVGPGDAVVTTPFTFFATASSIVRLGARPEFVDVDPQTFNMDSGRLHEWFATRDGNPPKAIVPVHLYGQCADMDAICATAAEHGVPVLEDAAQALGATYPAGHEAVHAGGMGAAGTYSFYPTKNLSAMGDAGMALTNDDALADTLRRLRNHGGTDLYTHTLLGGNFRMDGIQAAVLSVKLPHLGAWNAARRATAAYYDERLAGAPFHTPQLAFGREHHCYHQYVIAVPEGRDELRAHLTEHGVGSQVYYPQPLHLVPVFAELGYAPGQFPEAERAVQSVLALPIYPELTDEQRVYVADTVLSFF